MKLDVLRLKAAEWREEWRVTAAPVPSEANEPPAFVPCHLCDFDRFEKLLAVAEAAKAHRESEDDCLPIFTPTGQTLKAALAALEADE